MNKRAIAILGAIFILIVATLGFLIYSRYSSNPNSNENPNQPNQPATSTPTDLTPTPTPSPTPPVSSTNLVKLTDKQVVSPILFFKGTGVTFFNKQGNLFQLTFDEKNGQFQITGEKQLGIPVKDNVNKILWPATGDDFIAEIKEPSGKITWSYFNSKTGQYVDLPPQIVSLDWLPSGDKIMYIWLENNKATLNVSKPDSTDWQTLDEMWETDNYIHVSPDGTQILYYQRNLGLALNPINAVTVDGKVWKSLVKTGQNYGALWSPDGQKFLYAKKDPASLKYQLWVYYLTSGESKPLGLNTWTEKAVWDKDSNTVFAAEPATGTLGDNSLTVDIFYKVDTSTLNKKQFTVGNAQVDGRNLFLNAIADKLFFRNAQDGALYYLDLNK